MYGKSYVPVKWSPTLARHAQDYANQLASQNCNLIHSQGTGEGENLAAEWGANYTPDQVLNMWTEDEASNRGGHFTQVLWRGTRYIGCASATSSCSVQVCRYVTPGNCGGYDFLSDSSPCGAQCAPEGCF
jgi:uncharacterized protein YkwD